MKFMFKLFAFLYMFAPLLIVSYFAYYNKNWFLLFGILFCYLGSFLAASKSKIIYLVTLFCIGFWFKTGFDFYQYVTFFFFCLLWGYIIYRIAEEYDQQSKRGTLLRRCWCSNSLVCEVHQQQHRRANKLCRLVFSRR